MRCASEKRMRLLVGGLNVEMSTPAATATGRKLERNSVIISICAKRANSSPKDRVDERSTCIVSLRDNARKLDYRQHDTI